MLKALETVSWIELNRLGVIEIVSDKIFAPFRSGVEVSLACAADLRGVSFNPASTPFKTDNFFRPDQEIKIKILYQIVRAIWVDDRYQHTYNLLVSE